MSRPTTPEGILADALHRSRYPTHPIGCSCQWAGADELEALEVYDRLVENGAHVAYDLSLPSSAPSGVRPTSRAAAESLGDVPLRSWAVWHILTIAGPLTGEELNDRYVGFSERLPGLYPPQAWDSPRKRLPELAGGGHIFDTGQTRPTLSHRQAVVWQAIGEGAVAA